MEILEITNVNVHLKVASQSLSKDSSCESITSVSSKDETKSTKSKDSGDTDRKQLPVFTNQVVVIRPEIFYENEDC